MVTILKSSPGMRTAKRQFELGPFRFRLNPILRKFWLFRNRLNGRAIHVINRRYFRWVARIEGCCGFRRSCCRNGRVVDYFCLICPEQPDQFCLEKGWTCF
jgi:hypothetical protein